MAGPHDSEVAVVKRCDPSLAEPLQQSNDARIHHAELLVGVLALEEEAALKVCRGRALDAVGAGDDILQKRRPRLHAEPLVAPVVKLGQDERGDDEILVRLVDQCRAPIVIGVRRVEGRQQRARIEDEGHRLANVPGYRV